MATEQQKEALEHAAKVRSALDQGGEALKNATYEATVWLYDHGNMDSEDDVRFLLSVAALADTGQLLETLDTFAE